MSIGSNFGPGTTTTIADGYGCQTKQVEATSFNSICSCYFNLNVAHLTNYAKPKPTTTTTKKHQAANLGAKSRDFYTIVALYCYCLVRWLVGW